MEQEKDIVERLRNYERDPMWAHHAEVLKAHCKEAADEIERLRAVIVSYGRGDPAKEAPGQEGVI